MKNKTQPIMSVSREDIVREARALIGIKATAGGTDPATGLDHFGMLAVIAKNLGIIDPAILKRHSQDGDTRSVFWNLRRCVVSRKFAVEILIRKIQVGDFCTTTVSMGSSVHRHGQAGSISSGSDNDRQRDVASHVHLCEAGRVHSGRDGGLQVKQSVSLE